MSSHAETVAKMTARAEQIPTAVLCEALTTLDQRPKLDEAEKLTRAVLIDVLCERHPEADAAFDAWASDETMPPPVTAVEAITEAARKAAQS